MKKKLLRMLATIVIICIACVITCCSDNTVVSPTDDSSKFVTITTKPGFLEKVNVGIAQYYFELGAGIGHGKWKV